MSDVTSVNLRSYRVRGSKLPLEYELSSLLRYVDHTQETWNTTQQGCQWKGVLCCEEGVPFEISWNNFGLSGRLLWEYLPLTLFELDLSFNELKQALPLELMPRSLQDLHVTSNNFADSLPLQHLPEDIHDFNASSNNFSRIVRD